MLSKILIGIAAIVAIFAAVVAFQPAEFQVVRTSSITAAPATVFAEVNDFHRWNAWSPWAKIDPAMKQSHEGAAAGTGAIYSWAGNSEVGEGRMTIMESRPSDLVRVTLYVLLPACIVLTLFYVWQGVPQNLSRLAAAQFPSSASLSRPQNRGW